MKLLSANKLIEMATIDQHARYCARRGSVVDCVCWKFEAQRCAARIKDRAAKRIRRWHYQVVSGINLCGAPLNQTGEGVTTDPAVRLICKKCKELL